MTLLDASRTPWRSPRRPPVDDAYSAWCNANSRCALALRLWQAAAPEARGAAYREYVIELALEEAAADHLAGLHAMRAAA
jgi:hypothetical protein